MDYLYTSESVSEGHPDKICDQISDSLLDLYLEKDSHARTAIETLATTLGEEITTIEDVYEPYLIQIGYISRTPRGRIALPKAYEHLGYDYQTRIN